MSKGKYDAFSVAARIVNEQIKEKNPISNLVLQKVLYYAEAAFLVNNDALFRDEISAWKYGPVVEDVYHYFKIYLDRKITNPIPEKDIIYAVPDDEWEIINKVVKCKIKHTPFDLVRMTHDEEPWKKAYDDGKPYIDKNLMRDYFKKDLERIYE